MAAIGSGGHHLKMAEQRPDPDALLRKIEWQEEKARRGRLRVFFGAAAGVGKTYAMLGEARELRAQGVDVVAGLVETHGRAETETLLEGLERLPRRVVVYRGARLQEFDLDAALKRRPSLILVDELAHTNVEGSRHPKRWQDIEELLDAGISVYTTLNVQHLESLNDVVERITGIRVWETVPDKVLEEADEVELVDLLPDDLLQRLKEGKVYIPAQVERAIQNFFRKGNLIALRELALRRTADRVDAQMREYRETESIAPIWQVKERLIVCIGADDQAERIVRGGRRLAKALEAEWIAVYVETPKLQRLSEAKRAQVLTTLRLAEELGAETVTLTGHYIGETILAYAHERNATKIVLGKASTPAWRRWLFGSAVEYIVGHSADIDILFISGETAESEAFTRHPRYFLRTREYLGLPIEKDTKALQHQLDYLWAVLVVFGCTGLAALMFPYFELINLIMVYLLGVIFIAHRHGREPSILASILSVVTFDFFFVPPRFSFAVSDTQYLVTFAVMLSVALIISGLASSIRLQARIASHRERRTATLYAMSRELSATRGKENILRAAVKHLHEVFDSPSVILLPDERDTIIYPKSKSLFGSLHGADLGIAQWVYDHGAPAGRGTDTLSGSDTLYLPMVGSERTLGVIALLPTDSRRVLVPEQQRLLQMFASQIALALERVELATQAQDTLLHMETERLRNVLLSAISHDLRTPLAAIVGAASGLLNDTYQLDAAAHKELVQSADHHPHRGRNIDAPAAQDHPLGPGVSRRRGRDGPARTRRGRHAQTRPRDPRSDIPHTCC
jgi:two-component system sensor histidine kinase KdpD